tara:strand:- start:711 stop:1784 length:1074 start_codon:yes stop_codon:yes gene_type:complete
MENQTTSSTTSSPSQGLLDILKNILKRMSYKDVSRKLNLAVGTVKRWVELGKIPQSYTFELMKLADMEIHYSDFSFKDKDQFYTPRETAKYCFHKFIEVMKNNGDNPLEHIFIEPSGGNGSFFNLLPQNKRFGFDIEPHCDGIMKQDFLTWKPNFQNNEKVVVIGNPPFGLRGQLALKFINHSSTFADYICFILPQLFESDGKGVPRKRVVGLNLIHSEKLDTHFESPNQEIINVECIFQIWSKNHINEMYNIVPIPTENLKIYSLSDGGTPSTTRNKKMFYNCDVYLPSTCFGKENMKYYESFDTLPRRKGYGVVFLQNKEENMEKFKNINWSDIAFLSTNSAFNIRTSQIANEFI